WPTQPFPTRPPPFARQKFTVDDVNPYVDAAENARLRKIVAASRNEGVFTPPTATRSQISIPGELGGSNWGGSAADPETGMMYVRSIDGPAIHKLMQRSPQRFVEGGTPEQQGRALYAQHCEECHGPDRIGVISPRDLGIQRFKTIVSI